jgi:hypothetical protein
MAELGRPMDTGTAASIDPKVESIAIIQPRIAAPWELPLAVEQHMDPDSVTAPRHADIGKDRPIGQGAE